MVKGLKTCIFFIANRFEIASLIRSCHHLKNKLRVVYSASEPVRVMHVVHSMGAGGMENGVVNVIRELQGNGFAFGIACLTVGGPFRDRLPGDVPVVELHKQGGISPRLVQRLARSFVDFRPHVVHTHNWAPLIYGVFARGLADRIRILHGEHAQLSPAELLPRRLWSRRLLYRLVERVHTVSQAQRQELISLGFAGSKIEAVINGVDVKRFVPALDPVAVRSSLGLPGDALVIGMVGRFGPFKRHKDLIQAFEAIADRNPKARLLLVGGSGSLEQEVIRRVAESPCKDRIKLTGFMADPLSAYQAMDLLVVPSLNEGLSNAALEAMAARVPVLAHDACGNAELIGSSNAGWVRSLQSPEQLGEALNFCLGSGLKLTENAKCARERASQCFSMQSMTEGYRSLYTKVVQGDN